MQIKKDRPHRSARRSVKVGKSMEEKREEVKQPWECMAQAFAQINSLFLPVKKEEKNEEEKAND